MEIGAITWNLFHGRDFPPDSTLNTWRSRLWRRTERNQTHVQVNRHLFEEFAGVLGEADWDVALLQECPTSWALPLGRACGAATLRTLTSRNWLGPVRAVLARRNPDLLGSWGGGSNVTLVRGSLRGELQEPRELCLRRMPERRKVDFIRLRSGLCIANLHASGPDHLAEADVRAAADAVVKWAGASPLLFGGDLNLRPADTNLFLELEQSLGLCCPTASDSIDHLLGRGLEIVGRAATWPAISREVRSEGLALRLSDHAPVGARFRLGGGSSMHSPGVG